MTLGADTCRTGRCLCGDVRFEALGEPNWVGWCHCESCRRAAGTPVTAYAGYPMAMVRFTRGAPALYASSPGVERGFCARCGSSISFAGERWPGEIHLHLGCFDAADLAPTHEGFAEERLPWVHPAPP